MGSPRLLAVWRFVTFGLLIVALFWVPSTAADSGRQISRIRAEVDEHQRIPLAGHIHPRLREAEDQGTAPHDLPMERMLLLLKSSPEQEQELANLLADQQNPSSPNYHRWLTPQQFGERFGPSEQDVQTVANWLRGHGFQVNAVAQGRRAIEFSGTAGQVRSVFRTAIHSYASRGKQHWANAGEPQIPAALGPVIGGIASLHNFQKRPMHRVQGERALTRGLQPELNLSGGAHALSPYDFATIYNVLPLWNAGIDGTGQTIAIPSRSNIGDIDYISFRSTFGLPNTYLLRVVNGTDPGIISADVSEATLDVTWAGAVAKGASIELVISASTNSADGIDLSNAYIVNNNLAPIVSVSYGGCEQDAGSLNQFYASLWQQAAAQGMSVFVASGDSGSAGCDADNASVASGGFGVNALASTPYTVAVGGTQFAENGNDSSYWNASNNSHLASAKGYIPETTWNETSLTDSSNTGLWASGGGVSRLYSRPSWQTGSGVPADDPGASGQHHRLLPDVSLSAAGHDGYALCLNDSCFSNRIYLFGGTSASTPAFAGLMALVNQSQGVSQGNANFRLYPLSTVAGVYHDVTTGSNAVPCSSGSAGCTASVGDIPAMGGYSAGSGFDLATGWGSVDANALVTHWSDVHFDSTTVSASITPTTVQHGSPFQLQATVTSGNGTPSGSVGIIVSSPGNATEIPGAMTLQNGTASGTISTLIPGGASTVKVSYWGDGTYGASSVSLPLTVTPEPSTVSMTAPVNPPAFSPLMLQVTVTGQSGLGVPTGTVNCAQDAAQYDYQYLDANGKAACGLVPRSPGQHTYSATYVGDRNFSTSTTSTTINVAKGNPSISLQYPSAVVNGTAAPLSATVAGNPNFVAPTGSVQFWDGATSLGSASLANGKASLPAAMLALGTHSVYAAYSGDANFSPGNSTSGTVQVVSKGTVLLSLFLDPRVTPPVAPGSPAPYSAFFSTAAVGPTPTGTLTILDGSTRLWQGTVAQGMVGTIVSLNTASAPLSLGTHNLTLSYPGDGSWLPATSSAVTLTVANPDFTVSSYLPSVTVARGSNNSLLISTIPIAGMSGTANFSCSGMPAEATCTFSPTSAPLGISVFLTIAAAAPRSAALSGVRGLHLAGISAGALVLGVAMLPKARGRRRRLLGFLLLLSLLLLTWNIGCGGGGGGSAAPASTQGGTTVGGTPVGNYPITVTATSGGVSHTMTLNLTVY